MSGGLTLGRISYLNVLPLYHPLETGIIANNFRMVSGPPALLNKLMAEGLLHLSAASSVEYCRHRERYLLVPDLAIGSRGPVMSVLLLSRRPVEELDGKTIVVSSQTHTSAALLRILCADHLGVSPRFVTHKAHALPDEGDLPEAILAIGDEALTLRRDGRYPCRLDLGEAWREHTGLPFVFGVWLVRREAARRMPAVLAEACAKLAEAKAWSLAHMPDMCVLAADRGGFDRAEMCAYFGGLSYDLGEAEQEGLRAFFGRLAERGVIPEVPELEFFG